MEFLTEEHILHLVKNRWYWMDQSFPAHDISLRSAAQENFVIVDMTNGTRVIGEVDRFSAPTMIHEEAIYIHEGIQFQVEKLDYEEKKAFVRQVNVDYFTDASMAVQLKVLHVHREVEELGLHRNYGEVTLNAKPTIFKKSDCGHTRILAQDRFICPRRSCTPAHIGLPFRNKPQRKPRLMICSLRCSAYPMYWCISHRFI